MSKAPESTTSSPRHLTEGRPSAADPSAEGPAYPELRVIADRLDGLPLEERFEALCALAQADCMIRRSAAYRWLAAMHRRDLRYEMRAKRVLCDALEREHGMMRARVRRLMKTC